MKRRKVRKSAASHKRERLASSAKPANGDGFAINVADADDGDELLIDREGLLATLHPLVDGKPIAAESLTHQYRSLSKRSIRDRKACECETRSVRSEPERQPSGSNFPHVAPAISSVATVPVLIKSWL